MSCCSRRESDGLVIVLKHFVSSTESCMRNNSGPKIVPCGVPDHKTGDNYKLECLLCILHIAVGLINKT